MNSLSCFKEWLFASFSEKTKEPLVFSSDVDGEKTLPEEAVIEEPKLILTPEFYQLPFNEQVQVVYSKPLIRSGILDKNWKIPSFVEKGNDMVQIDKTDKPMQYVNPFSLWYETAVLFTEQVWKIKVCDYILCDPNDYSLSTALKRALFLPNAEVISNSKIEYYKNGNRYIGTDIYSVCFCVHKDKGQFSKSISLEKAMGLFPECKNELEKLRFRFDRLAISKDSYHILLKEKPDRMFTIFLKTVDEKIKTQNICFRNVFAEIADAVKSGNLSPLDNQNFTYATYDIERRKYCKKFRKYNFKVGFPDLNFENAAKLIKDVHALRKLYVAKMNKFTCHCKGFLINKDQYNIVAPMEVYESWGRPFSDYDLQRLFRKSW